MTGTDKYLEELKWQRDEITRQQHEIIQSIRYASLIQSSLLPPESLIQKLLPAGFILFKPRDIVSGDFYWMAEKDEKIYLAVADCTGHGVPGALMSILGISFLNEILARGESYRANRILNLLREMVMKSLHQTGDVSQSMDGMDIALCIYDAANKTMQYAGANNPLFMVRKDVLTEFKPDRMPIGISGHEEHSFKNHFFDVRKGDWFYLFSDGYVDQFGGQNGKKFKYDPFKSVLLEIAGKKAPDQKEKLDHTLEKWMGKYSQVDDILVMGARFD
ncbi:MAG: SpoIIE family protein phosphatase [Chlorobi bacterium]|nr:SpoIIE family protein phosphatase [Chlorobiota bacterium]